MHSKIWHGKDAQGFADERFRNFAECSNASHTLHAYFFRTSVRRNGDSMKTNVCPTGISMSYPKPTISR
jgi:hypothetical protein